MLKHVDNIWQTSTHLKLMRYLKENPKLKLIGFDTKVDELMNPSKSLTKYFNYFNKIELLSVPEIEEDYVKNMINKRSFTNYQNHLSLKKVHNSNIDELKKVYSRDNIEIASYFIDSRVNDIKMGGIDWRGSEKRDLSLMRNINWIINDFYEGKKMIIWASNNSISKVGFKDPSIDNNYSSDFGKLITQKFKNSIYSIGFFFSVGEVMPYVGATYTFDEENYPRGCFQKILFDTNQPQLFIDLNSSLKDTFLNRLNDTLINYCLLPFPENCSKFIPSKSYDGIIWIKKVNKPNYIWWELSQLNKK